MQARDIMQKNVITIPETATYEEVAQILHENNISGAPVVTKKGDLIGVISEKDLLRVLYPYYQSYYKRPEDYTDFDKRAQKVKEIKNREITRFMSKKPVTIKSSTHVMRVGAVMLARGVNRIPVLEEGTLVGIICRGDIYRQILSDHLGFN